MDGIFQGMEGSSKYQLLEQGHLHLEVLDWCWLGFGEGVKALAAFQEAGAIEDSGERIAGLAAAMWQTGQQDQAVAMYLRIGKLTDDERAGFGGYENPDWPVSAPSAGADAIDPLKAVHDASLKWTNDKTDTAVGSQNSTVEN